MFRTRLAILVLAFGFAASANAALHYDSTTTLTDSAGGSMITRSVGDFGADSGSGRGDATFNNFAPREGGGSVNGSMSRSREREGELVSVTYAGNINLSLPASSGGQPARTATVAFTDITVSRSEEGRTISGGITINGREMPAEDAPRSIIAILIGLVKLMGV
jgi:hypothetical protein